VFGFVSWIDPIDYSFRSIPFRPIAAIAFASLCATINAVRRANNHDITFCSGIVVYFKQISARKHHGFELMLKNGNAYTLQNPVYLTSKAYWDHLKSGDYIEFWSTDDTSVIIALAYK